MLLVPEGQVLQSIRVPSWAPPAPAEPKHIPGVQPIALPAQPVEVATLVEHAQSSRAGVEELHEDFLLSSKMQFHSVSTSIAQRPEGTDLALTTAERVPCAGLAR